MLSPVRVAYGNTIVPGDSRKVTSVILITKDDRDSTVGLAMEIYHLFLVYALDYLPFRGRI
jgi:hypothetical protein